MNYDNICSNVGNNPACNEALKAADVKLIDVKPYGASGRLIMSGEESQIDSAAEAANKLIANLNQMKETGGNQLG